MLLPPLHVLSTYETGAGESSVTLTIGDLVTDWDTFRSITSRHLVLIVNAASADAVTHRDIELQFNADTGANYNDQFLKGVDATESAARATGQSEMTLFSVPGTSYANAFGGGNILIPCAFLTDGHKAVLAFGGAVEEEVVAVTGRWASTAAITSITLALDTGDFATGSKFTLTVIDETFLAEEDYLSGGDGLPSFAGIASSDDDICIIGYQRSDRASAADGIIQTVNDDAGANYYRQFIFGAGTGKGAGRDTNRGIGDTVGNTATADAFGALLFSYSQYARGVNDPQFYSMTGYYDAGTPNTGIAITCGRRDNVEAIVKVALEPVTGTNFKQFSLFSLYRVPRTIIDRQILTAPAGSITFASIPAGYDTLLVHVYARTDKAALTEGVDVNFNGDGVAANYDDQFMYGSGGTLDGARSAARDEWIEVAAATEGANEFGGGTLIIPQYDETDRHKHCLVFAGTTNNIVVLHSTRWENTAAITQIVLTPHNGNDFQIGSVFELIGVRSMGTIWGYFSWG